jgi:ATP-dependent DNA helicase Rep
MSQRVSLNPSQQQAVTYTQGPLLVLAGAGSGKTRVITEKIAHLIRDGLSADKITAITFTNKAAREMRERAQSLLSKQRTEVQPQIGTFHALGLRFLQVEHGKLGLRRGFSIFDTDDSLGVMKDLHSASTKKEVIESFRQAVSRLKNEGYTPEQAQQQARSSKEHEAAELYAKYQQRLSIFNAVDFDDLIRMPLNLLQSNEEVVTAWRERIRYVLVDEYQDTNRAQYQWLTFLVGERGALTAVGDDDQSIYAWRGADPNNLNELARDFPTLKVIKLEQNYRSSQRILRVANAVISSNPHLFEKKLWSAHAEGPPIRLIECQDEHIEADRVAADIAHYQAQTKALWSEFAVLYRGNHQAKALEKSLRLLRIPYHLTGGQAFFERTEVKDLLAYLRLIANPDDDAAFLRAVVAPKRDVGASTLEKLGELASVTHKSLMRTAQSTSVLQQLATRPASAVRRFIDLIQDMQSELEQNGLDALGKLLLSLTGYEAYLREQSPDRNAYERRLANCQELIAWLSEGAQSQTTSNIGSLTAQLALLSYSDRNEVGNAVRLMTLHSAKGLEFRYVFLVGLEDGTLPHESSLEEGRLDEERRLFYVGLTRAKEQLTLSYAASKQRFGELIRQTPSRFIAEIPDTDLYVQGRDVIVDASEKKERAKTHLAHLAQLLEN